MDIVHDSAAIVSIGDELVRGQMLDTNSRDLAALLMDSGVVTCEHVTVGDSTADTADTIRRLALRFPLVIVTGGLGPTPDDLTRDAMAQAMGEELVEDAAALAELEQKLRFRGRPMTTSHRVQALRPRSALCLENALGTAPGLYARLRLGGQRVSDVYCLPGPPGEWRAMAERWVVPALQLERAGVVRIRLIRVFGLTESQAAGMAPGLMERVKSPTVGITASGGVLTWRIFDRGSDVAAIEQRVGDAARVILQAMGDYVFAEAPHANAPSLPEAVVEALAVNRARLTTVESCTGGMAAQMLTSVPGSSKVFEAGFVTYSNDFKHRLVGVKTATLEQHGAVSQACVVEMAEGGRSKSGAEYSLAISGVAGPEGGSPEKPVGTVWIGIAHPGGVAARCFRIPGSRQDVRERGASAALAMLYFTIKSPRALERPLIWEVDR